MQIILDLAQNCWNNLRNRFGKARDFVGRHWRGFAISATLLILFSMIPFALEVFFTVLRNEMRQDRIVDAVVSVLTVFGLMFAVIQIWTQTVQLKIQSENDGKQLAAEQFKNAIEHLGSHETAIILGGIHALHNLATNYESYRKQTLDILCGFIREETTKPDYKKLI